MRISDWSSDVCSSDLLRGTVTIRVACFVFQNGDIGARDRGTSGIEASAFLNSTAVAAAVKADLDAGDSGFLQAREKRQSRPSRPRYRSWTTSCRKEPTTIRWLQLTGARLSSDGRRKRGSGAGAKTDRDLVDPGRRGIRSDERRVGRAGVSK